MKARKILSAIMAIAMIASIMSVGVQAAGPTAAGPTSEDDVALLAGYGTYVKDLQSAFTPDINPDMKQVLMAKNWTGDIDINYLGFASSFYLNGYTLEGQLKLTDVSILNFYGIEPGNDWAGPESKIIAPNNTIYQLSGANVNISGAMTIEATDENGVAIYAENGKIILSNPDTVVKGKVVSTGTAIIKISAGTFVGGFEADTATNLEITGGTFVVDPTEYLPSGFTAVKGDDEMYTIQKPVASLDDLAKDDNGKYVISTPEDVVTLREIMSKQSIVSGTEFILANNIDMRGYTLASAGTDTNRFYGIFDGNDCTIFNVTIEGGTDSYVAFFGNVSGATIKDLTLENVTIIGGQYTAGIVGRARNSTVTNCKVIGNIKIEGHDGVGGIVGGGVANVTGCEVSGNDGSYIKGQWDVGGIAGLVSAGTSTVENNNVANIGLTAEKGYAGGIAGRVLANSAGNNLSISYNEVEDITIDSGDEYSSALLIGATTTGGKGNVTYADNPIAESTLTVDGTKSDVLYAGAESDENINISLPKTDIFGEQTAYISDITYQKDTADFYSVILLAGIDSLNYREVGFKVTVDETTEERGTNTVYTSILASDENGEVITVKPENFGEKVNYIFGQRYEFDGNFKTSALTFCPYAIDTNGNYIYGEEATIEKIYSK